jgi:fumarate hydratase class II
MSYIKKAHNFFLQTGTYFPRSIIWAMGLIKYAAAKTNLFLKLIDEKHADAIMKASLEIAEGKYDDKIKVDVFQTGSGTGLNMAINELIAEIASKDDLRIHPNDHVNLGQSSNDTVPTAIRMATIKEVNDKLLPAYSIFIDKLKDLSKKTNDIIKPGRTHLRDALPITMGQEFEAYINAFNNSFFYIKNTLEYISEVPLGGTAVGTGFNTHPEYPARAITILAAISKLPIKPASNRFRAMRLLDDLLMLSGHLRNAALNLYRLCQDIRLMFSGPYTGLGEIEIPHDIPGSSMLPGKTNPVTAEAALLASSQIVGLDHANQMAGMLGEFELSMGIPLIGYNIIAQITLLSEAMTKLAVNVIGKIRADKERCLELANKSLALITVISPIIGYEKATELANKIVTGLSIRDALREIGYKDDEINKLLDLEKMVKGGFV